MTNFKEFKQLIKTYESIKIKDIDENNDMLSEANTLTGFGSIETCPLCKAVDEDCDSCAWIIMIGVTCCYPSTYSNIQNAKTPEQLVKSFKERADYMKRVLSNYEKRW